MKRLNLNLWKWGGLIGVLFFLFPLGFLGQAWLEPDLDTLSSIKDHLGKKLLLNTIFLILGVSVLSTSIALFLTYIAPNKNAKYRYLYDLLAISPLAFPSYVYASTFIGLYGPEGSVTHIESSALSLSIVCLSLAFYPYLYLFLKAGLLKIPQEIIWQAQLLKASPLKVFFKIKLPLLFPWLLTGLLIVIMECLAEFGALSLLSLDTFTTAIYKTWFSYFSLNGASLLASMLLVPAIGLTILDKVIRKKTSQQTKPTSLEYNQNEKSSKQFLLIAPIALVSFFLPIYQLISWSYRGFKIGDSSYSYLENIIEPIISTLVLGIIVGLLCVGFALIISYIKNYFNTKKTSAIQSLASIGYAIPGTILAVCFFVSWSFIDNSFADFRDKYFGGEAELIIGASGLITLMALCFRFLASPINSLESSIKQGCLQQIQSARLLGSSIFRTFIKIVIPQNTIAISAAFLIVFIEVIKELPIVLMTRPIDQNFLSVLIYQYTSEGDWLQAGLPSLLLVIMGLVGIVLIRKGQK